MPLSINEYFNGLDNVPAVDTFVGVKDGVVTNTSAETTFKVAVQPIGISEITPIGYICGVPVDYDRWGLITGIDEPAGTWDVITFGIALAKVADDVDANDSLYCVDSTTLGWYELIRKSSNLANGRTLSAYPLAIALETPTNGFAKVFFFGGLSYSLYSMVSDMIYAALNP